MKTFRVTLKYTINSNTLYISATVPAYNDDQAIDKVTAANSLDSVTDARAEEIR